MPCRTPDDPQKWWAADMNQALYVYKKELRELLRDRRVRTSAILGPFLMVFLMVSTMGGAVHAATNAHAQKIHVVNPDPHKPILAALKQSDPKTHEPRAEIIPITSVDEGKKLASDGKA